jgi:integrase
MGLTVKKVEALRRKGVPTKVTDTGSDGVKGLMLIIENRSSAYWLLRYQRDKVTRHMGLGSCRDLALAAARAKARRERERLLAGVDPIALRKAERAAAVAANAKKLTFKQASERCFEAKQGEWSSDRYRDEFISSLKRWVWPHIGNMDVGIVGKDDVLRILEQKLKVGGTFWTKRTITADRTRNRIETILNWAEARGFRAAGTPNPARWKGSLSELLPKPRKIAPVKSMASVPYPQVPGVMEALATKETVAAKALSFLVLTASRISEVIEAERTEFGDLDLPAPLWTIPAQRMKGRREHTVPLAPQAVALLKSLPVEENNPYMFVSSAKAGTNVTEGTVNEVLDSIGRAEVAHGFRSSFRTWAGDCTTFHRPEIELSLAHKIGNAVELTYNKAQMLEKRRRLMEAWARYCMSPPVDETATDKVVPMRGGRPAS